MKGNGDLVGIDHLAALGNACVTGASVWDIHERAALGNDPYNLLAVDAFANRQKGDGDAAPWLAPNKPYRCAYVARQIGVKDEYYLWFTAAEKAAMSRVLSGSPTSGLPRDAGHASTRLSNNIKAPTSTRLLPSGPTSPEGSSAGLAAGTAADRATPCLPTTSDLDFPYIPDSEKRSRSPAVTPTASTANGDG